MPRKINEETAHAKRVLFHAIDALSREKKMQRKYSERSKFEQKVPFLGNIQQLTHVPKGDKRVPYKAMLKHGHGIPTVRNMTIDPTFSKRKGGNVKKMHEGKERKRAASIASS